MSEPAVQPEHSRRRKRILLYMGLALVSVLLAVGLWLAAQPAAPPLQGEVDAASVNVATKALARLETVRVREGDRVRAGAVLATLSSPEIANGQQQAQAALDSARAAQTLADEGVRPEDLTSLKATWQAAQAAADLAAKTSMRADHLYAEGVIAAQRRDEAHAARQSSASTAKAAKAQYLKAAAGVRPAAREVAAAQVRIAAAGAATADALGQETRLVSPIAGEVARRLVEPGELVSPVLPAFQVIDVDHPYVTINLPESQYNGIAVGRRLTGRVPALDRSVAFRVQHIAPQGEFATFRADRQSRGYDVRAFEVKLEPVQPVPALRPGMSVLFDWPQ
ncbi:biotin/lipoyl-binding protein [Sphingomonas sp. MA1305]|uniref:HlyD family secretion protein n=1 Tax=Sphingomonas sp. MA1305 TaxID=2479204 RepID=UPI0018DF7E34|nr:efflux RND transporter periplasmic adaptor subunit [Sphingomonas sp. MA1305]MBI0477446.1 biotin/lipoyl-binding protein [Sphingomonas sp. MA1305]